MEKKKNKSTAASVVKWGCISYMLLILLSTGICGLFSVIIFVPEVIPEQYRRPTPTPEPGRVANTIVFSGKATNLNSEKWVNDRLVVVYLDGQEIGRTFTDVGESSLSQEGVTNGYFEIEVPNIYEVPENRFQYPPMAIRTDYNRGFNSEHEIWFGEIKEGELLRVYAPTKNTSYYIKVLAAQRKLLPTSMLEEGSTYLTKDFDVVLARNWEGIELDSKTRALIQDVSYGVSQEVIEVDEVIVPINNCKNDSPYSQEYRYTQTFYHEYKTELAAGVDAEIPILRGWALLVVELEAKYGFRQGQVNTSELLSTMDAAAGENVIYKIKWLETWESGTALINAGDEMIKMPFRVRKGMTYSIEAETLECA